MEVNIEKAAINLSELIKIESLSNKDFSKIDFKPFFQIIRRILSYNT